MPGQELLILVRTVLGPTIRMMNATFRWLPYGHGHIQCADGEVAFHPVADSPTDDAARIQVKDDGKIQSALTGTDIADVTRSF